ncbi:MAG: TIGR00299 family protein [Acidimicrobiaceae bacterium]|nr:TIGR00299 family protein [Acidimicrobiaceae bacterium]
MTRLAWFHCFSGIAGDMALGALVDAGADGDQVVELVERLPVGGWKLEFEPVLRCGIAATKARVHAEDTTVHRTAGNITAMIEEAGLPERVARRSLATFHALAEVEGRLHNRPPSQVHFHEVGALDSIVDVVGTCAALEVLGIDEVHASSVATGTGMVRSAHGLIPVPAPATVGLLAGAPTHGTDVPFELTTPTGAALLAATACGWGAMPAMAIAASGFGAGDRDLDGQPNATQVVVGEATVADQPGQPVAVLEVNVDDATGEALAHAVERCLEAGAHDAWVTPIVMKKGRPAHVVSALCDPARMGEVAAVLTAETGSLGVRGHTIERWPAARSLDEVEVLGERIAMKVTAGRAKPEHDDAARAARLLGLPLREVVSLAEEAWRQRGVEPLVPPPDGEPA